MTRVTIVRIASGSKAKTQRMAKARILHTLVPFCTKISVVLLVATVNASNKENIPRVRFEFVQYRAA